FSLVLAGIIFALLNLFLTVTPPVMIIISLVFLLAGVIITVVQDNALIASETGEDDRGFKFSEKFKKDSKSAQNKGKKAIRCAPKWIVPLIPFVLALILLITQSINDMLYYIVSLLSFLAVLYLMLLVISRHNLLASSKLPQFNRTGGDDRA
ncbi:MAG: hypothetical protein K6F84_08525, partial [Lachnospiraceae bacterium]|nr:hypothetical protein [Lachnospiraceae bacterium]